MIAALLTALVVGAMPADAAAGDSLLTPGVAADSALRGVRGAAPPADSALRGGGAPADTALRAGRARPDTTLRDYLRALADSTDAYFGSLTAPADTSGLDSARVYALEHPGRWQGFERQRIALLPWLDFNRVNGPVLGGGLGYGRPRGLGRLEARLAAATGPNRELWHASYLKHVERGQSLWTLRVTGGRRTAGIDREQSDLRLAAIRAFLNGGDRKHYYEREGVEAGVAREGATHRLGLTVRDDLESARATTATWNVLDRSPLLVWNCPARAGRAREVEAELLWRVPGTPVTAQAIHASAGRALGSQLHYDRSLLAAGADIGVGRWFSFVPQLEYGALTGQLLPQAAFYLGGPQTLRSLHQDSYGGTRIAVARADLILVRDLFKLVRLPSPAPLPLEAAVFTAAGAVWGADPYGGPTRSDGDWPREEEWHGEAGVSLLYQPGLPDPTDFVRVSLSRELGPGDSGNRISISIGRALDLVRPFVRR